MAHDYDAVIVGGGPAGAMTALHLARLGWKVAIIERGARHREKTCGHCLDWRAVESLKRAGLEDGVRAVAVGCNHRWRMHAALEVLEAPLNDLAQPMRAEGLIVQRCQFDQFLLDRAKFAGAEVIQPAAAKVEWTSAYGVVIVAVAGNRKFRLHAPLIIGADGVGSAVARAMKLADSSSAGRKYGFSFDLESAAASAIQPHSIEMFTTPGGYLGVVRQMNDALHVAGLISPNVEDARRDPLAFCRHVAEDHAVLRNIGLARLTRSDISGFVATGPMPWRPRRIANARAALVGDAAGYIEPFTGEGMNWAIQSAETLADVLRSAAPGEWSDERAQQYSQAWNKGIGRRQRPCRVLGMILARRRVADWLVHAGMRFPRLTSRLVQHVVAT